MTNSGVTIEGLDDSIKEIDELKISDSAIKNAAKKICEVVGTGVEESAPNVTGYTKRNIKKSIRRIEGGITATISSGANSSTDTDWGTSKNRKYVGWFENGVEDKVDEVVKICEDLIKTKGF